jgi:hypothetical protein
MRSVVIALGLSAVLSWGSRAQAQSPGQQAYEKDEARAAVHQLTPAERVHERAASEAHARLARIESRNAMGISLSRPTMHYDPVFPALFMGMYGAVPYTVMLP